MVLYLIGIPLLMAKYALNHIDDITPFAPLIIFLWVVGFMYGRLFLDKLLTKKL